MTGNEFKSILEKVGYSQRQLALEWGVSHTQIQRVCKAEKVTGLYQSAVRALEYDCTPWPAYDPTVAFPLEIEERYKGSLSVSTARGFLWDIAQQIPHAWKDATGLHIPIPGTTETLVIRIKDTSDPGQYGYRHGLSVQRVQGRTTRTITEDEVVLHTSDGFDAEEIRDAVEQAIRDALDTVAA